MKALSVASKQMFKSLSSIVYRPSSKSQTDFAAERARMSRRSIPELIDLLESVDLRTRFLAEMCLRDATNT